MFLTINTTFHCEFFSFTKQTAATENTLCHVVRYKTHFSIYTTSLTLVEYSAWNPEVLGSIPVLGKKISSAGEEKGFVGDPKNNWDDIRDLFKCI